MQQPNEIKTLDELKTIQRNFSRFFTELKTIAEAHGREVGDFYQELYDQPLAPEDDVEIELKETLCDIYHNLIEFQTFRNEYGEISENKKDIIETFILKRLLGADVDNIEVLKQMQTDVKEYRYNYICILLLEMIPVCSKNNPVLIDFVDLKQAEFTQMKAIDQKKELAEELLKKFDEITKNSIIETVKMLLQWLPTINPSAISNFIYQMGMAIYNFFKSLPSIIQVSSSRSQNDDENTKARDKNYEPRFWKLDIPDKKHVEEDLLTSLLELHRCFEESAKSNPKDQLIAKARNLTSAIMADLRPTQTTEETLNRCINEYVEALDAKNLEAINSKKYPILYHIRSLNTILKKELPSLGINSERTYNKRP